MNKTEERQYVTRLRVLMGQGLSDIECVEELGVTPHTLSKLKQKLFSDELEAVQNETAAENWVRYHLKLLQCIKELDEVIKQGFDSDAVTALSSTVGAIKAKADLIDRVVERGQDLGVIPRTRPDTDDEFAGLEVESLRSLVAEKQRLLEKAAARYGVADYAELEGFAPDDIYPEPTEH